VKEALERLDLVVSENAVVLADATNLMSLALPSLHVTVGFVGQQIGDTSLWCKTADA
jgi:hypothetical protein